MADNKMYVKLNEKIGREFDELRIHVGYEKGGYNYFSGNTHKRGIYVYITPVCRNGISVSTMILGSVYECGYKLFLKEVGRKNQKQEDLIFSKIENSTLKDEIADLYQKQQYHVINKKIMDIIS